MALHAAFPTIPHPDGGELVLEDEMHADFTEAVHGLRARPQP